MPRNAVSSFGAQTFTPAHIDVLPGLHEPRHAFQLGQLRTQPRDHLVGGGGAAFVLGLQADIEVAGVVRALAAVEPEAGNIRVLPDHVGHRDHALVHQRKRRILRRLRKAEDEACVLLREEALRDHHEQRHRAGDGRQEHAQRGELPRSNNWYRRPCRSP
ncbi:hypothetical protein G6F68_014996 [Rhizopus microsporus]|nr:hypothetical protein G6F68_014996 [Rhizopus microsporus]